MDCKQLAECVFQKLRTAANASLSGILSDFNKGEIGVFGYLAYECDNITSGELSEKLNVSTARVASILNSLESKELIERKEDIFDKRKTLVAITTKGRFLANQTKQNILDKISYVMKELGEDDAEEYLRLVLKIKDILNKSSKNE